MQVVTAEQPIRPSRIFRWFDEQIIPIFQYGSYSFKVRLSNQHIQPDLQAFFEGLSHGFHRLAMIGFYGGSQLVGYWASRRQTDTCRDDLRRDHIDNGQVGLIVYRQRDSTLNRRFLLYGWFVHLEYVFETFHGSPRASIC
jgi:hypothetical protein